MIPAFLLERCPDNPAARLPDHFDPELQLLIMVIMEHETVVRSQVNAASGVITSNVTPNLWSFCLRLLE